MVIKRQYFVIINSFIRHVLRFVFTFPHSYRASIYMQIHINGHVYLRKTTFCGVPPCVVERLGCAMGKKKKGCKTLVYRDIGCPIEPSVK
jgi:hypothetical protein